MNLRRFTDTGEWTTRRYLALLGSILIWGIVAIDAWYLWPTSLHGSTSMVIVSGVSMEPTYFTGDLVIARKADPSVGDVIVYAPEGLGGSQIVHRIIGGDATEGWQMQGDNNDFIDPYTPKGDEVKGVVMVHYANFGRVTVLLLNPMVWAFVLLAAIVLLMWWSGDTCEDDHDDDAKGGGKAEDEPEEEEDPDLLERVYVRAEDAVLRMAAASADAGAAALATLSYRSAAPRHAAAMPRQTLPAYLRGSAIVAVLGLVAVFGGSFASASSLTVNTKGSAFTKTYTTCTTAALSAAPSGAATGSPATTFKTLTISGIPTSCNSKAIAVYAYSSAGALLISTATGATTGTSGTVVLTKNAGYNAAQVATVYVFIDTWGIQTTWTPPSNVPPDPAVEKCAGYFMTTGQIPQGTTCSLTTTPGGLQALLAGNGGPGHYRAIGLSTRFTPSGYYEGENYVAEYQAVTLWRITLDLTANKYGAGMDLAGDYYIYTYNAAGLAPGEDCSDPTSITFQERTAGNGPSADIVVSDAPISWMQPSSLLCSRP